MKKVLVVAPHADDECIGCAGTILKHIESGDQVSWFLFTKAHKGLGLSDEQITQKEEQLTAVNKDIGFHKLYRGDFPAAALETLAHQDMIKKVSEVFNELRPEIVYLPFREDAHSDHKIVFDICQSGLKSFRNPYVKTVRVYETLSETDFSSPLSAVFRPNTFVDISKQFKRKLELLSHYKAEFSEHPFPRSLKAVESQAILRGSFAGVEYAEAFMTIKEII